MVATLTRSHLFLLATRVAKAIVRRRQRRQREHRCWVRPVFLARKQEGLYHTAVSIVLLFRSALMLSPIIVGMVS